MALPAEYKDDNGKTRIDAYESHDGLYTDVIVSRFDNDGGEFSESFRVTRIETVADDQVFVKRILEALERLAHA